MSTTTTQLNDATQAHLIARAQARFEERVRQIKKNAEYNEKLLATSGYGIGGNVELVGFVIYSLLKCNRLLLIGVEAPPVWFYGKAWGIGVGGLAGLGAGQTAYDTNGLAALGEVQYHVDQIGGLVQITWYKDGNYIAEITVPIAAGVGVGAFWGSGSFSLRPPEA
jgi:hypothetical protein